MTKEELTKEIFSVEIPPTWRKGQFVFNRVDDLYGIARDVQFIDHVDCFYDNNKINEFIDACVKRINIFSK